jgi:hypothetical protein
MTSVANPITPLRPTPGNFLETPAPNRAPAPQPPDFGRRTSTFAPSQQNGALVPAQSQAVEQQNRAESASSAMTPVQRAARTINDTLAFDARYPDLESYVTRKFTCLRNQNCLKCKKLTFGDQRAHLKTMTLPLLRQPWRRSSAFGHTRSPTGYSSSTTRRRSLQ